MGDTGFEPILGRQATSTIHQIRSHGYQIGFILDQTKLLMIPL